MKTPEQEQPNQPTVLPWHKAADKEANDCARAIAALVEKQTAKELSFEDCMKITKCVRVAIEMCARHDPHAETLRLLKEVHQLLKAGHQTHMLAKRNYASEFEDATKMVEAHLATLSKPAAQKGSK